MMTCYDDAVRTIIDVPADQIDALDRLCRLERISRAEAIRRAIARELAAVRSPQVERAFGLWRRRPVDAVAYQRRLRREWEPPRRRR
jgi:hypothetical protein